MKKMLWIGVVLACLTLLSVSANLVYVYKPLQETSIQDYRSESDESWGILMKFDISKIPINAEITKVTLFNYIQYANVEELTRNVRVRTTFNQDWKSNSSIDKLNSLNYKYSSYKTFSTLNVNSWTKIDITSQIKENLIRKNKFATIRLEDSSNNVETINQVSYAGLAYGHPANWIVFQPNKAYLKIEYTI